MRVPGVLFEAGRHELDHFEIENAGNPNRLNEVETSLTCFVFRDIGLGFPKLAGEFLLAPSMPETHGPKLSDQPNVSRFPHR